jgi:osmotically-inducible protein OsmY
MAASAGLLASPGLQAQRVSEKQTIQSLYRALERLPQYGVFDFLSFTLDRGVVTLSGYSYTAQLKADAERAVKRVSGVDEVANRLEVLPVSQHDDRIRRDTFYRIYTDTSLSRYTSGGVQAVLREAYEFGRYPGMQPFGIYPIRIIVKGGRIMLVGSVDNSFDRQIAEVRAREVIGTFGVSNELTLPRSSAHLGK